MYTIYNLPAKLESYIVARDCNGELWFWGTWDRITDAYNAANEVGGAIYPKSAVIRG